MFKYFLFFVAMLFGTGIGLFLGLIVVKKREADPEAPTVNETPRVKQHADANACDGHEAAPKCDKKPSLTNTVPPATDGLIKSKLGEYISSEADPDEADEILEKMRKQDQLYCTLKES